MIVHYLKIAWRNLLKYRTQTAVNIVGLAVGFACFALSLVWIRYELTYDRYHVGAERLYLAYRVSQTDATGYDLEMKDVVPVLRESFPEVEAGLNVPGEKAIGGARLSADSAFMQMFGVRVLAGDTDFLHNRDKVAVTEDYARRLFGKTDVVGEKVQDHYAGRMTIGAVLSSLPHSSLAFDYWYGGWNDDYQLSGNPVLIRLRPDADIEVFARKAQDYKVVKDGKETYPFQDVRWMPLTRYHYSDVNTDQSVRFTYLVLFAGVGLLVVLSSLLNYLALFVTRMRIREREIALRRVNGASRRSLFVQFATEYALLVVVAGLVGMTLVELALPSFRRMSGVSGGIYSEAFLYFLGVLLLSLLMLLPFVLHIRHRTMGRDRFRPLSIGMQIAMGVLFTFATVVLMKQLYFLRHTDLGWERENIAVLHIYDVGDKYADLELFPRLRDDIARLACAEEVIDNHLPLLEMNIFGKEKITDWEGHRPDDEPLEVLRLLESSVFTDFYGMTLLQGRMMSPTDQQYAVLNETAARLLNLRQPVGTHITVRDKQLEVIGLLKDFHYSAPTVPVQPIVLVGEEGLGINAELRAMGFGASHNARILIKYTGSFADLREDIQPLAEKHGVLQYELVRTEDLYQEYLQSETLMLRLLGVVSVVCIVISAFGIFSMVTLSCERRRKEIAVRKVNGARVGDILRLFAREYLGLLVVACVVAFPVGYVLMKRWLENYVEQTPISAWIYIVIFVGMAALIALCISWRVWRAANENPAEVVKSE